MALSSLQELLPQPIQCQELASGRFDAQLER
jgi:hypothetical protein